MGTISKNQLDLHELWILGDENGKRLVIRCANLQGANLQGANLQGADLWGANLQGADLQGANLQDADLRYANLQDADLGDANLPGANLRGANLRGANLQDADLQGANLRGANLQDADLQGANLPGANLRDANLRGAKGIAIASDASKRLQAVANVILNNNDALDMGQWHTCETTHCLAGWAIHQAGELGRLLEASVGAHMAGLQLLGAEAAMHFYDTNEDAIKWLHRVLDDEQNLGRHNHQPVNH